MKGLLFLQSFLYLLSFIISYECPVIRCSDNYSLVDDKQCVYYHKKYNVPYYEINLNKCNNDEICDTSFTEKSNRTCVLRNTQLDQTLGLDTASCSKNRNCYSNICDGGRCKGKDINELCEDSKACKIGNYCTSGNRCQKQKTVNEICSSDLDCENDHGCFTQTKVCTKYFSLVDGSKITSGEKRFCQNYYEYNNYCITPLLNEITNECYGDQNTCNYKYKDINNQIFPGETFGTKLFDLTGKWIGNLGIMRNVSERLKLISELVLAKEKAQESDRLKSAFLANMSHEIRTPMNGILGFAKLLKEPDLSGEEIREFIDIIHLSGTRMLNIINDIVDISKIEAGQMKIILNESNINEQIDYIYTFFKPEVESKGMKLDVNKSLPDELAIITTDREKVYAVFTNLVKNAIKYSIEGTIVLGYQKKNDLIEFYVKDTGIGIHKDRQEAIFERFIQADIEDKFARQGAGLGLAICKSYIDMLGGRIWVESEYGVGSTFYFTLPYFIEPSELILPKDNIMLENNIMNFFSLQQYINELLNSLFIEIITDEDKEFYSITPSGKEILDYFIDRVPFTAKEKIEKAGGKVLG